MKSYYYKTGIEGKNTIKATVDYYKDAGGYCVLFEVGDMENGVFSWHIDADYFNFYQRPSARLLTPAGRRSEAKKREAEAYMEAHALDLLQEFARSAEELGAPHMEIEAA